MDLKDLNKQQLILLALLVSFITSIATGIVTVTLMDQAPPGVTQTINRVVEKTVQVVTPQGTKKETVIETVIVKEEDYIVEAAEKNSANVVRLGTVSQSDAIHFGGFELKSTGEAVGTFKPLGGSALVISSDGLAVTDKEWINTDKTHAVQTSSGMSAEVKVLGMGDRLALLQIATSTVPQTGTSTPALPKFISPKLSESQGIKIGQTTVALGLGNNLSLLLGVISRIDTVDTPQGEGKPPKSVVDAFRTTMTLPLVYSGGPLLNTRGEIVGINIIKNDGEQFTVPASEVTALIDLFHAGKLSLKNSSKLADSPDTNQTAAVGEGPLTN